MMHGCGGRRFQLVATDRPMHERSEEFTIDTRGLDGSCGGFRTDGSRFGSWVEESSFANARHQFETAGRQPQAIVNGSQLPLDFVGRDDMRRKRMLERSDRDVLVAHEGQNRSEGESGCGY